MTQNKVPLNEPDIPIVGTDEEIEDKSMAVLFDGHKGRCFIWSNGWHSEKIIIVFDDEHPHFGKEWGTKYYMIKEPGVLSFGHHGETLEIYSLE